MVLRLKNTIQILLENQLSKLSSRQQKKKIGKNNRRKKILLDIQIAFFNSRNIPFNVAENANFQRIVSKLQPGYKLTSSSCQFLYKIHSEALSTFKKELNGKTVNLLQESWSNIHNFPSIVNYASTGQKSFFPSALKIYIRCI